MSANQMKLLWILTGTALLVMLLYLGNHLRSLMEVDENQIPGCVIDQGQCEVEISPGQRIKMSVSPWPILALQPVKFEVISGGIKLHSSKLALTGKEMYMGIHQYTLAANEQFNRMNVTGTISVCTKRVMPWRGRLDMETSMGPQQIWFDFDVLQH